MKLGGWGQLFMPKILKVTSRSSGVIQGGVNIGVWTWNLVGGVNWWRQKFWRSLQGHQGSSKVKWVNIGIWRSSEVRWSPEVYHLHVQDSWCECSHHYSGSPGVIQSQMGKHWCMDTKLGGWGQFLMPKTLKVTSRSSGVIQGPMGTHLCMDVKPGRSSKVKCRKAENCEACVIT